MIHHIPSEQIPVIAVVGPTAVGKTKLSVELAKALDGEVINADSTQIFKGLDIATAKVTEQEKEQVPHHLFDLKEMTEDYTVYDYQKDSRSVIEQIRRKHKIPILVGGTGLYLKACLYDYQFQAETTHEQYETLTDEELYQLLLSVDPATTIHPNNRKRVVRAYHYYLETGQPFSQKPKTDTLLYPVIMIGLTTDRAELYERINQRVDVMLTQGLLAEAEQFYQSQVRTKAVMTPIGYKELFPYFDGNESLEACLDQIRKNSRHYAKRQYTWFQNQMKVTWFEVNFNNFQTTVDEILTYIQKKTF